MNRTWSAPIAAPRAMLGEHAEVGLVGDDDRRRGVRTRATSRSPSGTSRQPRFGAIDTKPSVRRTTPTTATPTPISALAGGSAGPERVVGELGEVGARSRRPTCGRAVGRSGSSRGRRRPGRPRRPPANRPRSRGPGRRRPSGSGGRAGTAGRACPAAARAPRSRGRRATSSPMRPRIALRVRPVRATSSDRDSGPRACSSRTIALRFARRTVSLRWPMLVAPHRHRFVFLSAQMCCARTTGPSVAPSVSRMSDDGTLEPMSDAPLGHPVDRPNRPRQGHPRRSAKAARCEVVGDRVARRRARRGGRSRARHPDALTARTRRCSADPDIDVVYIPLPNHLHARVDDRARSSRQARPVREAARADGRRRRRDGRARAERRASPDGGVHVPPSTRMGRRARRSWRPGGSGALVAVDSWFSYFNDDPANIREPGRCRWRRAVRHRLLLDQPVADAVRRGAGPGPAPRLVRDADDRRRRADQRDPRVRRWRRDVHLLDPGRAGPAGRTSTATTGRISVHDPVQHPARSADRDPADRRRRPAGRARDARSCASTSADPYTVEADDSRRRSSTACRPRRHPRTPSRTCGSSSGSSRPATRRGADRRRRR